APLRNPAAPGWPARGERTEHQDVAERWKWKYIDVLGDDARRAQIGLRPRAQPLGATVARFLAERELTAAFCTRRGDSTVLETHLIGAWGAAHDAEGIDRAALQTLFSALAAAGYAPGTLQKYLVTVGAFFTWLGRVDADNPARGVVLPAIATTDVRTFTLDELEDLRAAADDFDAGRVVLQGSRRTPFPMRRAVELGLGMGGRQAELFALEWPAFREASCTVRLTVQLARDGRALAPLKGKRARTTLVLPSWWAHHERRGRGRILGLEQLDGPRVLHLAYRWINYLYDHAGLNAQGQAWHVLRHTYARIFVEAGGRLEELQKSLGHTSILTTEQAYGHLSEDAAATLARQRIYGTSAPQTPNAPAAAGLARAGQLRRVK
ncbi:MAG TPA: tyrosine-type recombinase/integrase, partial [Gemmatimonadaceae bacterium]|nr:tyrosine-type recombinase/integrase [Gemmatimonadaceae bacterium]